MYTSLQIAWLYSEYIVIGIGMPIYTLDKKFCFKRVYEFYTNLKEVLKVFPVEYQLFIEIL